MNDFFNLLNQQPVIFYAAVVIINLIMGRWLALFSMDYPLKLQQDWQQECHEFLNLPKSSHTPLALRFWKASYCQGCLKDTNFFNRLTIITYLIKQGTCPKCAHPFDATYPAVESITLFSSILLAFHYGPTQLFAWSSIFTWGLISLSTIDYHHRLLPDPLTIGLLWLGLLASLGPVFIPPEEAILAAFISYTVLWIFAKIFTWCTGKEGMGYGDFKLLAASGAWLGLDALLLVMMMASLLGITVGLWQSRGSLKGSIPFGPFLAIASWCTLLWQHDMMQSLIFF